MVQHLFLESIKWAAIIGMVTLVLRWIASGRLNRPKKLREGQLVLPKSVLVIGIICFSIFLGITVISNTVGKNETTTIGTTSTFLIFSLVGLVLILEYVFSRYQLTANGIQYGTLFGKTGSFNWDQVIGVKYSPRLQWFEINLESSKKIRISSLLIGIDGFSKAILENIPYAISNRETFDLLMALSDEQIPPNN